MPFRELRVEPDKSLPAPDRKPPLDDNLIIHGDNLEALKALLPTHAGKVDCIFIDPPYNTGKAIPGKQIPRYCSTRTPPWRSASSCQRWPSWAWRWQWSGWR